MAHQGRPDQVGGLMRPAELRPPVFQLGEQQKQQGLQLPLGALPQLPLDVLPRLRLGAPSRLPLDASLRLRRTVEHRLPLAVWPRPLWPLLMVSGQWVSQTPLLAVLQPLLAVPQPRRAVPQPRRAVPQPRRRQVGHSRRRRVA